MPDFTLTSERLALRPLSLDRLGELSRILSDPDVVKMLLGDISTPDGAEKEARNWIDDDEFWQCHRFGSWGIHDSSGTIAEADILLGLAAASPPLAGIGEGPEIFYFLGRDYWGRGIVGEAAARLCRYLFDDLQAPAIEASIFAEANPGSIRVAEKLGMRPAGRVSLRDHGLDDGRIEAIVRFDIWRVETAPRDLLEQTLAESAFRVGQILAEDIGTSEARKAQFNDALTARNDVAGLDLRACGQIVDNRMALGRQAGGLALYRVRRDEFGQ